MRVPAAIYIHIHLPQVGPGGMGGTSDEVTNVPLFAYKKGGQLGTRARRARSDAGSEAQVYK